MARNGGLPVQIRFYGRARVPDQALLPQAVFARFRLVPAPSEIGAHCGGREYRGTATANNRQTSASTLRPILSNTIMKTLLSLMLLAAASTAAFASDLQETKRDSLDGLRTGAYLAPPTVGSWMAEGSGRSVASGETINLGKLKKTKRGHRRTDSRKYAKRHRGIPNAGRVAAGTSR